MKTVLGFAGVLLVMGNLNMAHAEDMAESHIQAAKLALSASKATTPFDQILPGLSERVKQGFIQIRPDLSDDISRVTDETAIEVAARRGDLENEAARVYAKVFSEDELKTIAEFYNSPAGQKLISEAPILAREMSGASKVWANGIYRDLSDKVRAKLKDKGL